MKSILAGYSLILCMWAVFVANVILPYDFNQWGIEPRSFGGLPGIFCWSFLHGSIGHIIGNTIALLILIPPIFAMHDEDRGVEVILGIGVLAGIINWVIGTTAIHIGASGMVYGLAAYGIAGGLRQKNIVMILYSIGVCFYMGSSLIFGMFPKEGISWTGHAAGIIAGVILAGTIKLRTDHDRQPKTTIPS